MRRLSVYILLFFVILLTGCNKTLSEIGSGFVVSQPFDVALIDTVTFRASTIVADSLITSSQTRLLVGHYVDQKLGPTTSFGVFEVAPPSSLVALDPNTTSYTALTLHLIRDGYSFYDTIPAQTISVYQLKKQLQLFSGVLYNVDKFSIDRNGPALGTITYQPDPHKKDSLEIPLSDDLGRTLMTMMQTSDPNLNNFDNFRKFFNGLVLVPDTLTNACFMGFKTASLQMRLYYHDFTVVPPVLADKYIAFTISANNIYYNKIQADRSATKLAPLHHATDILPSTQTENMIYLQGGTGVAMRIEMPYLRNLLFVQSNFQCTRATLQMLPVTTFYDQQTLPPPQVSVGIVDAVNNILTNSFSVGGLYTDPYGNTSYNLDVTTFINNQLTLETNNDNALFLQLPNPGVRNSVNRLYVGDGKNEQFLMKLSIYFIVLSADQ